MSLYIYQKAQTNPPPAHFPRSSTDSPSPTSPKPAHPPRSLLSLLPLGTSIIGLVLIFSVAWPIVYYEILGNKTSPPTTDTGLLNPLADSSSLAVLAAAPKIVGSLNYTHASNWFPNSPATTQVTRPTGPNTYTLSIPKLNIENAHVIIGSDDLSSSLIHYNETALPGQLGSPVIFGHSILPQFYNPKNYMSIFSTLPTLEKDDQIIVDYDGISYTYSVTEKQEVMPEDLWVLEQRYDSKKIKLITCVPPGLKTKRLVVTAELQPL
mgnify:CR=1 FL=1